MPAIHEQTTATSEDIHPIVRTRCSGWISMLEGGMAHFSGYREATINQTIEMEANESLNRRPSCSMDDRTMAEKGRESLQLLIHNPAGALTLLRINRHPPMISWEYDDSDDWPGKRWRRALALHKGEAWNIRELMVLPKVERDVLSGKINTTQPDSREIPRFLLKDPQDQSSLAVAAGEARHNEAFHTGQ